MSILIPKQPDPLPGQLTIQYLWLGYAPLLGGAPRKLATASGFTAAEVAASQAPYPTVWGPGDVTMIAAWDALEARIATLFPNAPLHFGVDDGVAVVWSDAILPSNDRSAFECDITGKLDPKWAGKTVTAELQQGVVQHGQIYTKSPYESEPIDEQGYWIMYRCPRERMMTFLMPDLQTRLTRYVPNQATIDFSAMSATATPVAP